MEIPADIPRYLELHATELGARILSSYPALHGADDVSVSHTFAHVAPSLSRTGLGDHGR